MSICLHLSPSQTQETLSYQILTLELTGQDRIIEPQDIETLELPTGINPQGGIVISGRGPIWLYGYLIHELHPTSWIACYDPRLGAIVVSSHSRKVRAGQVLSLPISLFNPLPTSEPLCPALMIVGPPDSGKSVLSHALFKALLPEYPNIYLQRANWDGEGNYSLELGKDKTQDIIETFKAQNRGGLTERFYPYHAQAILQLRRHKSLLIVDVGGMVQPEKYPILEACSHYLIISSQRSAVNSWHEFCGQRGNLTPVAVISSVLTNTEEVHQVQPYLEITSGAWVMGQAPAIPEVLLKKVKALIHN